MPDLTTLAGEPTAIDPEGISPLTIDPAPIMQSSPITAPGRIIDPTPINDLFSNIYHLSVAIQGHLYLYKHAHVQIIEVLLAIKQHSPIFIPDG